MCLLFKGGCCLSWPATLVRIIAKVVPFVPVLVSINNLLPNVNEDLRDTDAKLPSIWENRICFVSRARFLGVNKTESQMGSTVFKRNLN